MTNFERIKQMSIEEMLEQLTQITYERLIDCNESQQAYCKRQYGRNTPDCCLECIRKETKDFLEEEE